ncbi:serine/threonine-protein kinase [Sorangium cellulosum]|uniref:serine/threonine-protein kinase n=1 Tax=Sorangium cellulosum TaxID=56 RepID=UPI003D9A49FD
MVDGAGLGYRIVAQLAGRGRADVYAAVDRAGRSVLLYVSASVPEGFLDTLERLRAVSALLDELPRVLDGGVGASFCWAAVERCDGPSLRVLLEERSGILGPPWALSQVAEFAEVLRAAHASGIFHGDLRPETIVLFGDGSFRLPGLGLAQLFGLGAAGAASTGSAAGAASAADAADAAMTTAYRAPEQLSTSPALDERTDVYALGLVLYELLGLRRPFEGCAPEELARGVLHRTPQAIETLVPLPPSIAGVVRRAIEKDPAARYRGMEELIAALHAAIEGWCRWQAEPEQGALSGVRIPVPSAGGARSWPPSPPSPGSGPPTLPSGVTSRPPGDAADDEGPHALHPGDATDAEEQPPLPLAASADRDPQRAPPRTASADCDTQHTPPLAAPVALPEVPPLLMAEPPLVPPQPAPPVASPEPVVSPEAASPVVSPAPAPPAASPAPAAPAPGPRRHRRIARAAGALAFVAAAALLAWSQLVSLRGARVPTVARLPRPCALVPAPAAPPSERHAPAPVPREPPPRTTPVPPRTTPVPPRARPEATVRAPSPRRPFEEDEPQPPCGADWYTCGAQWPGARSTTFH